MANFVRNEPCPKCHSQDNLARYDDGSAYCFGFGCHHLEQDEPGAKLKSVPSSSLGKPKNFVQGTFSALKSRGITEDTCRRWGYQVAPLPHPETKETVGAHIANHYSETGELTGQQLRFGSGKDKTFQWIGKATTFYGKHLAQPGKILVITEGQLDALAVSQIQGHKYPVVSLPDGAGSAARVIKKELQWLEESFEKIVLMFDQDKVGQEAAIEVAPLFSPGKCFIAKLPEKDANDMLLAGKAEALINAIFRAKPYRPDGIVTVRELREQLDKPVEWGLSYPWSYLTELTYGMRLQEFITLGAGTGCGKTESYKEIIVHLRKEHDQKVGVLFLEEASTLTLTTLAGKIMGKPIHIPDVDYDQDEKQRALDLLGGDDIEQQSLVLYGAFGGTEFERIKGTIRHMAVSMDCKWIFLDHLTALVSGDAHNDERKELDEICTELAGMCRELDITIFAISHLTTADGKPHEEGGRVMLKHMRGSRAIGQWSSFVFGIERDQQNPDFRNKAIFRILKDRYSGQSTGWTFELEYNAETGRLTQVEGSKGLRKETTEPKNQKPSFRGETKGKHREESIDGY